MQMQWNWFFFSWKDFYVKWHETVERIHCKKPWYIPLHFRLLLQGEGTYQKTLVEKTYCTALVVIFSIKLVIKVAMIEKAIWANRSRFGILAAVWFLFNLRLKLEFLLPTPRLATTCWAKQSTEFFCSSRFHEEIRHGWFIPFFFLFQLGYNRSEIEESLRTSKFDDCYASYLLLGRKPSDVSQLFLQNKTL